MTTALEASATPTGLPIVAQQVRHHWVAGALVFIAGASLAACVGVFLATPQHLQPRPHQAASDIE